MNKNKIQTQPYEHSTLFSGQPRMEGLANSKAIRMISTEHLCSHCNRAVITLSCQALESYQIPVTGKHL